jgi:S-adenosylmethionine:tRNA ribosyltransferase-isomerase
MSSSYDFDLPRELIAQTPPARRGDSRLLLVAPGCGVRGEVVFRDLPTLLRAGDRLVLNDSRVLPARLLTRREDTGGRVEILLLRPADGNDPPGAWLAMARPARRLRAGLRLVVAAPPGPVPAAPAVLTVTGRGTDADDGQVIVAGPGSLAELAETRGVMPLPPYIERRETTAEQDRCDRDRYQTVYAAADESGAGSVAAPTAGLHFSQATLDRLLALGVGISRVCLHVGPGTFQPPAAEQIAARRLHREFFRLPAGVSADLAATRAAGGRVIAVGTTALRVIESAARLGLAEAGPEHRIFAAGPDDPDPFFTGEARRRDGAWEVVGATRLFVRPPDRITAADGLLTNFHLPDSSLLMLVAALLGPDQWRGVYAHAVRERLRFYSYGDCMLILPGLGGPGPECKGSDPANQGSDPS